MSMSFNANQNLGGIYNRSQRFQPQRAGQAQQPTVQEQIVQQQTQPDVKEQQLEQARTETSDTSQKGRQTKEEGAKQFSDAVRSEGKKQDDKKARKKFSRGVNAKTMSSAAKSGQTAQTSQTSQTSQTAQSGQAQQAGQNLEAQQQTETASNQLNSQGDLAKLQQHARKETAPRKPSSRGQQTQMVSNLAKWANDEVSQYVRGSENIYTKTGARKIAQALNNMYGSLVSKNVAASGAAPTPKKGKGTAGTADDSRSEARTPERAEMEMGVLARVAAIFEKPEPPEGYVPLEDLVA